MLSRHAVHYCPVILKMFKCFYSEMLIIPIRTCNGNGIRFKTDSISSPTLTSPVIPKSSWQNRGFTCGLNWILFLNKCKIHRESNSATIFYRHTADCSTVAILQHWKFPWLVQILVVFQQSLLKDCVLLSKKQTF